MEIINNNVSILPSTIIKAIQVAATNNDYNGDDSIVEKIVAHSSFNVQIVNTGSDTLTYNISISFDGENWSVIKTDDILTSANDNYKASCQGTLIKIEVKSKVTDTPTSAKIFLRLNPYA